MAKTDHDALPKLVTATQFMESLSMSRPVFYRVRKTDPNFPIPAVRTPVRWHPKDVVAYYNSLKVVI